MLVVAWCCAMGAWAYDFEADGIYYGITSATDKTVEVVSGDTKYSGDVTVPATVTYNGTTYQITAIGNSAFSGCRRLTSVVLPEGVVLIGENAFGNNSTFSSITLPRSLTTIKDKAFSGCPILEVLLPDNLKTIGSSAFMSCSKLSVVEIPASVSQIGEGAFSNCRNLQEIKVEEGNTHYTSIDGVLFDKSGATLVVYPKGKGATYTIPKEVTIVNGMAFYGCEKLSSVDIPQGMTTIGRYAFNNCSSLTSITLPKSLTSIGDYAFYGCTLLREVRNYAIVPPVCGSDCFYHIDKNCILYIPKGALDTYKNAKEWQSFLCIAEVENASGVIAENFEVDGISYHLTSLAELAVEVVAGNVEYSGDLSIPATVTYDGITYRVTSIGNSTFRNCTNLTSITLPEGVISIAGNYAFAWCSNLVSISLPQSLSSIGSQTFKNCSLLTSIIIPGGVTDIGSSTFSDCSTLASVSLSQNMTSIKTRVFYRCSSLSSIVIPKGITSIGNSTFEGCSSLQEIYCQVIIPPTCGSDCFLDVDKTTCTLYVPKGTLDAYKAADEWKDFVNIVEEEYTGIEEVGADSAGQAVITACGNGIVVENLPAGTAVTVYTLSGTVVYEGVASGSRTELTLPAGHLYLVKCGSTVTKVAL